MFLVLSSISATIVQNSSNLRNDWDFATPGCVPGRPNRPGGGGAEAEKGGKMQAVPSSCAHYGAGSDLNNPSADIAASNRAGGSDLFQPRIFGSHSSEIVYLIPSPVLRFRMTTIAMIPGGAFSGAICKVPCPGLAWVAIMTPSTTHGHGGFSPL